MNNKDAFLFGISLFDASLNYQIYSDFIKFQNSGINSINLFNSIVNNPKNSYSSLYSSYLDEQTFASRLIDNTFQNKLSSTNYTLIQNWIMSQLGNDVSRGEIIYTLYNVLYQTNPSDVTWGEFAKTIQNKVLISEYFSTILQKTESDLTKLKDVLKYVNSSTDLSTTEKIVQIIEEASLFQYPQQLSLTQSSDYLIGGTNIDWFVSTNNSTYKSISSNDIIDGKSGTDKLSIIYTDTQVNLANLIIKNIEILELTHNSSISGETNRINLSLENTELSLLKIINNQSKTNAYISFNGNISEIYVDKLNKTSIIDTSLNSKLNKITVIDNGNFFEINVYKVSEINLINNYYNFTLLGHDNSQNITYNLNNSNNLIIDNNSENIKISSITKDNNVKLNFQNVKNLTIEALSSNITINELTTTQLNTLILSGTKNINLNSLNQFDNINIINSNTGNSTFSFSLGNNVSYVGSNSIDNIIVNMPSNDLLLGKGDDFITITGALINAVLDGGEGIDTINISPLNLSIASSLITSDLVRNFEKINLNASSINENISIDLNKIESFKDISYLGGLGKLTLNGLNSELNFNIKSPSGYIELNQTNNTLNTNDTITIEIDDVSGYQFSDKIVLNNLEYLTLKSNDTNSSIINSSFTLNIESLSLTKINLQGNIGFNLGQLSSSNLYYIEGSSNTGDITFSTKNINQDATYKFGNGKISVDASSMTNGLTFTSGYADDILKLGSGINKIDVGNGNNNIIAKNGNDDITVGTGNSIISVGNGIDKLTLGTGNHKINISTSSIDTDSLSIKGLNQGDILIFNQNVTSFRATEIQITQTQTITLNDYLNASFADNSNLSWFRFSGNTYIIQNVSTTNTYELGKDSITKIEGDLNLSSSHYDSLNYSLYI